MRRKRKLKQKRPRAECAHCKVVSPIFGRALCFKCYYDLGIRSLYKPKVERSAWLAKERDLLLELVREGATVEECCRVLKKRPPQIMSMRHKIRAVVYTKVSKRMADLAKQLAGTMTDKEVMKRCGCGRSFVLAYRKKMGIPRFMSRADAARRAAISAIRKGTFKLTKKWEEERIQACLQGWPAGTTKAQARVMELIEEGINTSHSIGEKLGVQYRAVLFHLRALVKKGFLTRTRVWRGAYSLTETGKRFAEAISEKGTDP